MDINSKEYKISVSVAGRLKKAMEYREITVKQLSEKTGISKSTIYGLLSGNVYNGDAYISRKLAKALNVNRHWLLWNAAGYTMLTDIEENAE